MPKYREMGQGIVLTGVTLVEVAALLGTPVPEGATFKAT